MKATLFYDMHSGGTQKLDHGLIVIEAREKIARAYFEDVFGRNPENISCNCCGWDYDVSEFATLTDAMLSCADRAKEKGLKIVSGSEVSKWVQAGY